MAVAKIGDLTYDTLPAAITAANALTNGATIELISDIVLGQKLTITKDITIVGEHTINRTTSYTGNLFTVNSGKTLTLDGGLIIDGGNNWTFDMDRYNIALMTGERVSDVYIFLASEEGGVNATARMFSVTGTLNLNNITIRNHYSDKQGLIATAKGARINLNGTCIMHCANALNSGLIADASAANIYIYINEGTLIDGNFAGNNHGLFKMYSGSVLTMNGGTIQNTTGCNANGVIIGLYGTGSTLIMNGGVITKNSAAAGANNSRNASIYVHRDSTFIMNDGIISYNIGYGNGGIDAPYTTAGSISTVTINGGSVIHNVSVAGVEYPDIRGADQVTIIGGTFTQDISKWCADDFGAVLLPDGTWGVKTTIFQAYVCVDGVVYKADMYTCVNGTIYKVNGIQSRLDLN